MAHYGQRPLYRVAGIVEVEPIIVYFKDDGELAKVSAGKAFDHEDAREFTRQAIDGGLRTKPKRAFLTLIEGGHKQAVPSTTYQGGNDGA